MGNASKHYAVTAIGCDRPGIVARVTEALLELGCNIEDTQMTILRGRFSMMLVVSAPDDQSAGAIQSALGPVADALALDAAIVNPVEETQPQTPSPNFVLSAYGPDRPGIVAKISGALADLGVDITDLNARFVGEPGGQVYAMMVEMAAPADVDEARLRSAVKEAARKMDVEFTLRPMSSDAL